MKKNRTIKQEKKQTYEFASNYQANTNTNEKKSSAEALII
jgi:hypothetical protein